jgi:hypothetical protein
VQAQSKIAVAEKKLALFDRHPNLALDFGGRPHIMKQGMQVICGS